VAPAAKTDIPAWNPPSSREKATMIFSPKPTTGSNIFKGDGDKWLADAIITVEMGSLTRVQDNEISDYVSKVGQNLVTYSRASAAEFQFIVLSDRDERAFTPGGGRIYITLGMLKAVQNEDELAGIISHEIGHNAFKHAPKTVTRQLFWMTASKR